MLLVVVVELDPVEPEEPVVDPVDPVPVVDEVPVLPVPVVDPVDPVEPVVVSNVSRGRKIVWLRIAVNADVAGVGAASTTTGEMAKAKRAIVLKSMVNWEG